MDASSQEATYAKLAALYGALKDEPLYQALLLVHKGRVDRAAGRPVEEAAAYVEAGRRFLDEEERKVAEGRLSLQEFAHLGLVAFDTAVQVYQEHGLDYEAGTAALYVADQLKRCEFLELAGEWYLRAADRFYAALPWDAAHPPEGAPAPPVELTPALFGAVQGWTGAADIGAELGDFDLVIAATGRQASVCRRCPSLSLAAPLVLHAAFSLALALLVQKLYPAARAALELLHADLEAWGVLGGDSLADPPPEVPPSLTDPDHQALMQAWPLVGWLAEECEGLADLPTLEGLCEQLIMETAFLGDRPPRLLWAIAQGHRHPQYLRFLLHPEPAPPEPPETSTAPTPPDEEPPSPVLCP